MQGLPEADLNHLLPTSTTEDERQRSARVAILPIGSFEQHGTYLPLITDTAIAATICQELADEYPLLQLPPITISCSHEHSAWTGTVSISPQTLYSIIADIASSLNRARTRALVLVNGHGGNYVLSNIVQEANARDSRMALFPTAQDWKDARSAAQLGTTMHEDMHAGEIETSILLHAHPELSLPLHFSAGFPGFQSLNEIFELIPQRLVRPEQQRLGRRLAQFQYIADLPIIHPLVLVHQHCHALAFRQAITCARIAAMRSSRTILCSTEGASSATSGVVPDSSSGASR